MKINTLTKAVCLAGSVAVAGSAMAAQKTSPDHALDKYQEDSVVTLSGTIRKLKDDSFMLEMPGREVKVEVNDWNFADRDVDLKKVLTNGEGVTVNGKIDKDWFSDDSLKADNIYLKDSMTYLYVVDANPAYMPELSERMNNDNDGAYTTLKGTISKVNEDSLVVSTGDHKYKVDLEELHKDFPVMPMSLAKGDKVFVSGEIDNGFFQKSKVEADTLIRLYDVSQNQQ